MKTTLECIPCFFKQAIDACRMLGLEEERTWTVLDSVARHFSSFDRCVSPPVIAGAVHGIIRDRTGISDPYLAIKRMSNDTALAAYDRLSAVVWKSADPLLHAVEVAIAGNIIDFGALADLDVSAEIDAMMRMENGRIAREKKFVFDFEGFVRALDRTRTILYVADNAGEIVCDRILIDVLLRMRPGIGIVFAVRGGPIINDALYEDAVRCGIDRLVPIIRNGSNMPGTVLESCSPEFRAAWERSDMIIAKGQGNFESLYGVPGNIHFMFIAKCAVIARHIGCNIRDVVLCSENSLPA